MNAEETGRLLATCASYDNRKADETVVIAWLRVLGDLPFADCDAAVVAHYTSSREWIMPADIRGRVKRAQREAAEREQARILLDPVAYRRQLEAQDSAFLRKLARRTGHPAAIENTP
jgi:hypothetical protein